MKSTNGKIRFIKRVLFVMLTFAVVYMILSQNVAKAARSGDYEYTITGGNATITKYYGTAENVVTPSKLDGYTVTSIGSTALSYCTSLKEITIQNGVTYIGGAAFFGCDNLKKVILPDSVTSISSTTFGNCYALEEIRLSENITSIGSDTFMSCRSLKNIVIPNKVKDIGGQAFAGCYSLTHITIPQGLKSLANRAFYNCTGLESMVFLDEAPPYIYNGALENCNKLSVIYVPGGSKTAYENALKEIGINITVKDSAARSGDYEYTITGNNATITKYYGSDENVIVPSKLDGYTVTAIGICAFSDHYELKTIEIPNGVTTIGSGAFVNCWFLEKIIIPNSVTNIESNAFFECVRLKEITIPNNVTKINDGTFYYCDFEKFTIPDSVTSIDVYAFAECSKLNEITIPDSVMSLGDYVFTGCGSLESVTFKRNVPPVLGKNLFNYCNKLSVIYVPDGSKTAYENALKGAGITIPVKETPTPTPTPTPIPPEQEITRLTYNRIEIFNNYFLDQGSSISFYNLKYTDERDSTSNVTYKLYDDAKKTNLLHTGLISYHNLQGTNSSINLGNIFDTKAGTAYISFKYDTKKESELIPINYEEQKPNNTIGRAYDMGAYANAKSVSVRLRPGVSVAYYKFTLPANERIYARCAYQSAYEGMSLEARNANDIIIQRSTSPNDVINPTSIIPALMVNYNGGNSSQTFFIRVNRGNYDINKDMYLSISLYNRIRTGTGTFTVSGTATNSGHPAPPTTAGTDSSVLRLNLTGNTSIPPGAVVRTVSTSSTMTPSQGNVHHKIMPENLNIWFTALAASATSGSFSIREEDAVPVAQAWQFRYNVVSPTSSTMTKVSFFFYWEYDLANNNYNSFQ